jgi:transposase
MPSDPARRTRPVWQSRIVPALSALLPALPDVSRVGLRSAPTRLLRQPGEGGFAPPSTPSASRRTSASWRTDASIKLSSVASSLKTVSARAMLTAMIEGETNPLQLANLAKGRMRRKIPDLAQALTGTFEAHHAQLAKSMLRRLELVEQALAELDAVIAEACRPWAHQLELLQTIPGVGETVAQVIVAETGADMSRFPTPAHLAAWAGLAPAMHESAGRQTPAGKRHGNKWLTAMLVEAAGSVGRMRGKNYLAAQHARLTRRRGMGRAQVAVAHSMLVSAYWMLTRDEPYHDLGADWHSRRNNEAHTRRLVLQLERLGHTVIIDPAA